MAAARRVHVLGGGPAGLFVARLLALRCPGWHVHVYERNPPEETFGFAIGLTGGLLRALEQADPDMHRSITDAAYRFSSGGFRLPQGEARLGRFHSGAIARAQLLRLLLKGAREAGVRVEIGRSCTAAEVLGDADLVIAADGVSSATRNHFRQEFGAQVTRGRGRLIWCGAEVPLDGGIFMPVTTPDGLFVAHGYPYGEGLSSFVIDASASTLAKAGFGDRQWAGEGQSDEAALEYLSRAFSELLGGGSFIGNRSRWGSFNTVRCTRWHHGKIVLLGDAAATAHPSLGSGTKIAMESAIALADAVTTVSDEPVSGALERFEATRRPEVERLQERATRSQLWWESFEVRRHLTPARLAVAYLSRSGAVSLDDLAVSDPQLVRLALADFADVAPSEVPGSGITDWVLGRPLEARRHGHSGSAEPTASIEVTSGDAWGLAADELLAQAREFLRRGVHTIRLIGADSRSALLDRLAVGERIKTELSAVVEVTASPEHLRHAADGIVTGRADLVRTGDGS
ncbi:monooxygenase [Amycolatopsis balhimycina DSM 5908]|uniref:Monooxygenase n=1 Tax=Amycolatopsis balhimycina DSM 5908 TaxID=1081091 RepID=A0A428WBC6_AMYBA|nr:FAD-dependent monooxygenase [Amycolatopsis balhimycina]RSM40391.1 monooxygenase [Amycolatopsis balhimycina DSM 5908]